MKTLTLFFIDLTLLQSILLPAYLTYTLNELSISLDESAVLIVILFYQAVCFLEVELIRILVLVWIKRVLSVQIEMPTKHLLAAEGCF